MQRIAIDPSWFQGAIEVEQLDGYVHPWRLPASRRHLFPSPNDGLINAARHASGVRLRFRTDSQTLIIDLQPLPENKSVIEAGNFRLDLTIDGKCLCSATVKAPGERLTFRDLPAGEKTVEVWLPQNAWVGVRGIQIEDGTTASVPEDRRPRWVTYGSSLTHCVRAHSPSRTWPAILARRYDLNLTSLGFGGQCHLDAMVATLIRDLPAEYITLKLGINTVSGTLSARTFPAAVIGLVQIIREKHPQTPLALISPMGYPPHETTPNRVDYTIGQMREAIEDVYRRLVGAGDRHLIHVSGLEVFSLAEIAAHTEDQCHPDADGIELQAENFDRAALQPLLDRFPLPR